MTDKIVTVDRKLLGRRIGVLDEENMLKISQQLTVILGL